jgi:hypothetical protein
VELVGIAVGLGKIGDYRVAKLVVRVCPFFSPVPSISGLLVRNSPVHFHGHKVIDIREWDLCNRMGPTVEWCWLLGQQRQIVKRVGSDRNVSRLALLFEGAKKEKLVSLNWTADRAAILVAVELGVGSASCRERLGIEAAVLE